MLSVVNNLSAINAQRQYGKIGKEQSTSMEKLSSGYKINRAADDAAGLTISEKMRSLIRGLGQGSDNIQDGVSLMQIADGALAEVHGMLQRMNELAVQAANGTNTDADRAAIQAEVDQIVDEIDRIGESTTFNTMHIFDRSTIEARVGTLTSLVPSSSADDNKMTEAYAANGKYYPSASIDFSKIDATNIDKINGGSFSFVCPFGCMETFNITFATDDTPSSATGLSGKTHNYTVNIKGATSGSEVVDKIFSYVSSHPASGVDSTLSATVGGIGVSHASALVKSGDSLIVLANEPKNTAQQAIDFGKSRKGRVGQVDASGLSNLLEPEPVLEFNIQCSNVVDDNLTIRTRLMDATYIGVRPTDVSTQGAAQSSITKVGTALAQISSNRSEYGAYQNRLESAYANNENKAENTTAAESRIRDTDMAKTMVNFTKAQILEQVGVSVMSQANQSNQNVLSLLQ